MNIFKKLLWLLLAGALVLGVASCSDDDDDDDDDDPVVTFQDKVTVDSDGTIVPAGTYQITIYSNGALVANAVAGETVGPEVAWGTATVDTATESSEAVKNLTIVTVKGRDGNITVDSTGNANKCSDLGIEKVSEAWVFKAASKTTLITFLKALDEAEEEDVDTPPAAGDITVTTTGATGNAKTVTLEADGTGSVTFTSTPASNITLKITEDKDSDGAAITTEANKATVSGLTLTIPAGHGAGTVKVVGVYKADDATNKVEGTTAFTVTLEAAAPDTPPALTATDSATTIAIGGNLQLLVDGAELTASNKGDYTFHTYTAYTNATTNTATVTSNKVTISDTGLLALAADTDLTVADGSKIYVTVTKGDQTSTALELTVAAAASPRI